ncbi:MAG: ribosomal protein [Candidatus Berkelbacteria bacterium]|nr:ribosomal protein [Candidatus Berkelbacteria bacterium]
MLKYLKPTTQSRRKMSVVDYSQLSRRTSEKKLTTSLRRSAGRDNTGQISVRHQGGGAKRKIRLMTSLEKELNVKATVEHIEYDPNRSAFIALVNLSNKTKGYILAWEQIKVGDIVQASEKTEIQPGNRMPLINIPNGIGIYDIEMKPFQGGKLARSAGMSASIVAKEGNWIHIKMPSGEVRKILKECFASIGQVSNISHSLERIGKAGRKRHMGIRPSVRGKAMNPNSHPHGGGEGVNPIGLKYSKTPWGKHARGVRTRKKNKYSNKMIIERRKK